MYKPFYTHVCIYIHIYVAWTGDSEIQVGRPQRPRWNFSSSKGGPPKLRKKPAAFHQWWGCIEMFDSLILFPIHFYKCIYIHCFHLFVSWHSGLQQQYAGNGALRVESGLFHIVSSWDLAQDSSRSSWVHFDSETCMAGPSKADKKQCSDIWQYSGRTDMQREIW